METIAKRKTILEDYDGFAEKKKTTGDCYTPHEVYNCVLDYVSKKNSI